MRVLSIAQREFTALVNDHQSGESLARVFARFGEKYERQASNRGAQYDGRIV
jgi:lysophospholipid acyltransferase (LPLAT)-like uncharacterized protein